MLNSSGAARRGFANVRQVRDLPHIRRQSRISQDRKYTVYCEEHFSLIASHPAFFIEVSVNNCFVDQLAFGVFLQFGGVGSDSGNAEKRAKEFLLLAFLFDYLAFVAFVAFLAAGLASASVLSTTAAPAFFCTEAMPRLTPAIALYISLLPMTSPFVALRTK